MSPSQRTLPRLLDLLSKQFGATQAQQELRWMRQTWRQQQLQHTHDVVCNPPLSLEQMASRRLQGEPLQYILGTQPFGPIELLTRKPVLIPRPETEDWTIRLSSLFNPTPDRPIRLLDLCTGSGCIPLLLCHLWPRGSLRAIGVDKYDHAIQLAKDNSRYVGMAPGSSEELESTSFSKLNTFSVVQGDVLYDSVVNIPEIAANRPFDVLTANPPYIPKHEYDELPPSVRDFEDPAALLGAVDPPQFDAVDLPGRRKVDRLGLSFYNAIADLIGSHGLLKQEGLAVFEVGHNQSRAVEDLIKEKVKTSRTEVWKDPWGVERCVLVWK